MDKKDPFIDEAAEYAVLGTILTSPERLLELDDLSPAHLASPAASVVLWAVRELEAKQLPINFLSVSQRLKDSGKMAAIGGPAEMMKMDHTSSRRLGDFAPSEALEKQVSRLKDLAQRRAGRALLRAQEEALADMQRPASVVLLDAAGKLTEQGSRGGTHVPTGQEVLQRSNARIDAAQAGQRGEKYIRTGLRAYDEFIGGVPVRRVSVLAAHPGVGKSGLMDSMALALADPDPKSGREPEHVYFAHIEDEAESFTDRHLAEHSGLSLRELGSSGLSKEQLLSVHEAGARIHEALGRIRLDDERGLDVKQVVARARYYVRTEGVRVVMVDHALQLVQDPSKLHEKVWVIINTLADFSHRENVAVVLALHLADPEDKKQDARYVRPTLQMMAGGRMIDRAARVIVGMRLCPPPRKPELKKGTQAQPRGKNVNAELLERWQAEQRAAEMKYHQEVAAYEERRRLAENRVLLSSVKANEGRTGYEFWMERIAHAGLFYRDKGGARDGEMGFSPGPASTAA